VNGWVELFGRLHPVLVHFPVALILTAAFAEALYMSKREQRFGDAARFMIAAAAWLSVPAAAAGFAAASSQTIEMALRRAFSVHWVVGAALPVLAFLAHGTCESVRRSGLVWEQMLYRLFLLVAVAGVLAAAYFGGLLAHAAWEEGIETSDFGLTMARSIWY
jgi:uncharacterized membrane protein